MNMMGYVCEQCPLAFEVGSYGYRGISGVTVHYVCRHCGTMHKIVHLKNEPDKLFAIDGPIPEMVTEPVTRWTLFGRRTYQNHSLPINEDSWRFIDLLPTNEKHLSSPFILPVRTSAVNLCTLACTHCLRVGGLVSDESPAFLDDRCPVCEGRLQNVYDIMIF